MTFRLFVLGSLPLLLAACGTQKPQQTSSAHQALMCRATPDGAPPAGTQSATGSDRGTGGTGETERGMGGTGEVETPDRGSGGTGFAQTGIVGVVTGFASICVNDTEIAYDSSTSVAIEDATATASDLRVGDLVVINAEGSSSLRARQVSVIYQVSGPIEAIASDGGLTVAGQSVVPNYGAHVDQGLMVGDWVAVSGLRVDAQTITASRVTRRAPGVISVRGLLTRGANGFSIGAMAIDLPSNAAVTSGAYVVASGVMQNSVLQVSTIRPDLLASDPTSLFGPGTGHFLIQSYVQPIGQQLSNGTGWSVPSSGQWNGRGRSPWVLDLQRQPDGSLVAEPNSGPQSGSGPFGGSSNRAGTMPSFGPGPQGLGGPAPMGGGTGPGGPGGGGPPPAPPPRGH